MEGTGSWGVGLSRFFAMTKRSVVVEVDRPNCQTRRREGKSDPTDAVSAARSALSGEATVTPKSRNDRVEQMRVSDGGPTVGASATHTIVEPATPSGVHQLQSRSGSGSKTDTRQDWCLRQQTCGPAQAPTPSCSQPIMVIRRSGQTYPKPGLRD